MEELQAGGASNSKSFQHFKTQIDKLTKSMTQLEKDTANWRQKYEVGGCWNFQTCFLQGEIFSFVKYIILVVGEILSLVKIFSW